jgi:hypothetical protein
MPVSLPDLNPKRELARKLFDSVISQIPFVGGPYVAMLSVTHRADAEKKIGAWREEITKSVNNLEQAISDFLPTITLSSDASALGLWFSKNSTLGRSDSVTFDAILAAFPTATKLELEDACGELDLDGLVVISAAIGHKIRLVRPTNLLFEIFDPIAIADSNPRLDAAHLAQFILRHDEGVSAESMLKEFGWNARRLNPATTILYRMVGEGRRSAEIHPIYDCRYIMPDSTERTKFKRYIAATLGEQ